MKIRPKNRKWILYFWRLGKDHENFREKWEHSKDGDSGVQCFMEKESTGIKQPCRCNSIDRLTSGKKIHGLMVDMIAKDWAEGLICKDEVVEYCNHVPNLYEEIYWTKWREYA